MSLSKTPAGSPSRKGVNGNGKHVSVLLHPEEFVLVRNISAELGIAQSDFLRSLMEGGLKVLRHTRGTGERGGGEGR